MKKQSNKLGLRRTTLSTLTPDGLAGVAGGATTSMRGPCPSDGANCSGSCNTCAHTCTWQSGACG